MPRKRNSKKVPKKRFKFNVKKILEERQKDFELSQERAEIEEQMKTIDDLFEQEIRNIFDDDNDNPLVTPKPDFIFDYLKYNIPFGENAHPDITKSCSQRLLIMSIEQNELQTNIHFNHLMKAKWSPELNDVRSLLCNWKIDLDNVINEPLLKHKINDKPVARHNFELVMYFIIQSIHRCNKFSDYDLLILSKFAVVIYFDHHFGKMCSIIKLLFNACIETALHEDSETDIIKYAQELYSKYEVHLLKMTSDLFLPLKGQVMSKIYTYLTFKLYKSITGKVDSLMEFPSNEWFVQDFVDKNYFNQNPKNALKSTIKLLEHVVITFDLYKDEKKLKDMYDFLHSMIKNTIGLPKSQKLLSILDHWKLQSFRLHIKKKL